MNEQIFPDGYYLNEYGWKNIFENTIAINFNHRWIAMFTFIFIYPMRVLRQMGKLEESTEGKLLRCLIWGANDKVTPPHVAEEFHKLLPNSELNWIPKCGHAAMWEHPKRFSEIVLQFLKEKF